MKLLLVHNDYGKYSDEEAVVDKMAAMMAAAGWDVAQLRMSTAGARENLAGKICIVKHLLSKRHSVCSQ